MMSTLLEFGLQLGPSKLFTNSGKVEVLASDPMRSTSHIMDAK